MTKALFVVLAFLSTSAFAGEKFLGTIVSAAGADVTNATTAAPFVIPTSALISVQCTAAAYVITDDTTAVTAARGINVTSGQFLPTSTSNQEIVVISSQVSSIVRVAGPAAVNCTVWTRRGNE